VDGVKMTEVGVASKSAGAGPGTPLDWALRYAKKGWAVLPVESIVDGKCTCGKRGCRSPGKHPRTEHGVDDASTDPETIRAWWAKWPTASIGIACGDLSGLWVLDVDAKAPKEDGAITGIAALAELESRYGELPLTLEAATGGGGRHLFFLLPPDRKLKNKVSIRGTKGEKTGLDVRSTGGYVVVHPSVHASGSVYQWSKRLVPVSAPKWLLDLIKPAEKPQERIRLIPRVSTEEGDRARHYCLRALEHACVRIQAAADGGRHEQIVSEASNIGRFAAGGHLTEDEVIGRLVEAGIATGKDRREVERTVRDQVTWARAYPKHPDLAVRDSNGANGNHVEIDPRAPTPDDEDLGTDPLAPVLRKMHFSSKTGLPLTDLHNVITILSEDPEYKGHIRWNAFQERIEVEGGPLRDVDVVRLRSRINQVYRAHFGRDLAFDAVRHVADGNTFDPLVAYLDSLTWDGVPRIQSFLTKYFSVQSSPLVERYGAKWLIGAVARGYVPGEKVDTVLILKGPQGVGKSTGLAALVPEREWFTDDHVDVHSKEGALTIRGKWIVEFGELASFRGKALEAIKDFLTRQVDRVRDPYERIAQDRPRRTVFAATTNQDTFLFDTTGARRQWVAAATSVDVAAIRRDRDQLWAEAVVAYKAGTEWHLSKEEAAHHAEVVDEYQVQSPWEPIVAKWLTTTTIPADGLTTTDVLRQALNLDAGKMTRTAEMDVAAILRRLGYVRVRKQAGSVRRYFYERA
jgi:predicted P-loop ATPase